MKLLPVLLLFVDAVVHASNNGDYTHAIKLSEFPEKLVKSDESRRLEWATDDAVDVRGAWWIFDDDGLKIFNTEGEKVKAVSNDKICILAGRSHYRRQLQEDKNYDCNFRNAISDGKKYVFATNTHGGGFVEVFNIDTAEHIGSIPTCNYASEIRYAPHRDEIWVYCRSPNSNEDYNMEDTGHVDSFSSNAWGLDHSQIDIDNFTMTGETAFSGHGNIYIDSSTPNYAWATMSDTAAIIKINVWTRAFEEIKIHEDECHGFTDMAISSENQHAFVKCYVCCSCGVDGDTGSECSSRRAGNVTLTTPINSTDVGEVVYGRCGSSCEGTVRDTVGIIEFDLVNEEIVGYHLDADDASAPEPHISPSGDIIVMLPSNVDNDIKILKAGANGEKSSDEMASNVRTNFYSRTDNARSGDRGDVLFIEDDTHHAIMFTSPYDNFVILADMDSIRAGEEVPTRELWLVTNTSHKKDSTAGSRRAGVIATGTNLVWVTGYNSDEFYIIDLGSKGDINDAHVKYTVTEVEDQGDVIWIPFKDDSGNAEDGKDGKDYGKRDMFDAAVALAVVAFVLGLISIGLTCMLWKKTSLKRVNSSDSIASTQKMIEINTSPSEKASAL